MNSFPSFSLWLPGLLIAIELLLQGWSLLFLGFAAKSLTKYNPYLAKSSCYGNEENGSV